MIISLNWKIFEKAGIDIMTNTNNTNESLGNAPLVEPGSWISFGGGILPKDAVVCNVGADYIEVVYLDDKKQAINEDMVWKEGKWQFKIEGPTGGYADKSDRLKIYVSQLKRGRY